MNNTILVCFAHPDDAELWAGGTLLSSKSKKVKTISICFETHDKARSQECIKASKILNIDNQIFLSKKTDWWIIENEDLSKLIKYLIDFKPDVIITHPHDDLHPEHRLVFNLVVKATIVAGDNLQKNIKLLESSSYNGVTLNGLFQPTEFIDISDFWEDKLKAIHEYKTQIPEVLIKFIDSQTSFYGNLIKTKRAEGFRKHPVLGQYQSSSLLG